MKKKCVVEIHEDRLVAGTLIIAEGFGRRHNEVVKLTKKYKKEFAELAEPYQLSNPITSRKIKTDGRPVIEFLLNEAQTIFLGSMFRAKSGNDPVLRFKVQLAKDFVKQKKVIAALLNQKQTPKWIKNRAEGKQIRREETDTIKDFITYCTKQGSKTPKRYYTAFSRVVNDSMFEFNGKFKNKREAMTANQLKEVQFADRIVSRGIIEGMATGMHYKDIYKMVRDRLVSLGEMYGKGEVISKQLELK